jgi:Ca2+-binding EF-hand superfamily protein
MFIKQNYQHLTKLLSVERNEEGKSKRIKMFQEFDKNGNGFLSLSEMEKGLSTVLGLLEISHFEGAIKLAFNSAKDCVKNHKALSKESIEMNEFRFFLCCLRQNIEYFEMFKRVNTDHDKYIDFREFVEALPLIEKWGLKVSEPLKAFREIDLTERGKIRYDEFCHWAIKYNLDIETDDDFEDFCFDKMK